MKTQNKLATFALRFGQSKWFQPTVLTGLIAVVIFGIAGCQPHH